MLLQARQLTKWQLFSLKMTTLLISTVLIFDFSFNLVSFNKQLYSFPLRNEEWRGYNRSLLVFCEHNIANIFAKIQAIFAIQKKRPSTMCKKTITNIKCTTLAEICSMSNLVYRYPIANMFCNDTNYISSQITKIRLKITGYNQGLQSEKQWII